MVRWGRRHAVALAICCAALALPRALWDRLRLPALAAFESWCGAAAEPDAFGHDHRVCAACRASEAALARAVRERDEARAELARLGLLRTVLDPEHVPLLVRARVLGPVSSTPFSSGRVRLGAGARDGVVPGACALWGDALVGRVVAVSPRASELLLVTAPAFRVRASCAPAAVSATAGATRAEGIARGDGQGGLWFRPDGVAAPRVGDLVTVAPGSSVAPPGLAIGVVTALEHDPTTRLARARLRPTAPLARLGHVLVPREVRGEQDAP